MSSRATPCPPAAPAMNRAAALHSVQASRRSHRKAHYGHGCEVGDVIAHVGHFVGREAERFHPLLKHGTLVEMSQEDVLHAYNFKTLAHAGSVGARYDGKLKALFYGLHHGVAVAEVGHALRHTVGAEGHDGRREHAVDIEGHGAYAPEVVVYPTHFYVNLLCNRKGGRRCRGGDRRAFRDGGPSHRRRLARRGPSAPRRGRRRRLWPRWPRRGVGLCREGTLRQRVCPARFREGRW